MLKSWWYLVQYLLRYLVWYVEFCHIVPKGTETPCIISGVSGPIFAEIAKNLAKIVPFNTCKSELRYSNPLRNASVLNKGHFANFAQNRLLWQRPLNRKKMSGSRKFTQIPFIWWKDRENRSSRSWDNLAQVKKEEEIVEVKIYSPVGKLVERAMRPAEMRWDEMSDTERSSMRKLLQQLIMVMMT